MSLANLESEQKAREVYGDEVVDQALLYCPNLFSIKPIDGIYYISMAYYRLPYLRQDREELIDEASD